MSAEDEETRHGDTPAADEAKPAPAEPAAAAPGSGKRRRSSRKAAPAAPAADEVTAVTAATGPGTGGGTTTGDATSGSGADEARTAISSASDAESVAADAGTETAPAKTAVAAEAHPRGSRVRRALVGLLVVIACLGVVVSGVAWWAHHSLLDTNGYVNIISPVAKDPQNIKALSDYVATQVIAATDLEQRTSDALPPRASFLAAPITDAVDSFIAKETNRALSTPQAYNLWIEANRIAHSQIVGLLRGENKSTYIVGSDVKLNTLPLVSRALVWINGKLPGALASKLNPPVIDPNTPPAEASQQISQWVGRPLPADFGQITLLRSDSLGPAQQAVKWFDILVWVLPIVTLLLVAAAIWLSQRRRRTIIELGIGVAIALVLTHVILNRLTDALYTSLGKGNALSVVQDLIGAALGPLTTLTIWLIVAGAVVAAVAWIVGRRDIHRAVAKATRQLSAPAAAEARRDSRTALWVSEHTDMLRIAGIVVGLVVLLLAASSWFWFFFVVVLVLLFQLLVSWMSGRWPFVRGGQGRSATG